MPSPATVIEFLELVRKSGVIDEKKLDAHLERLRSGGSLPGEPNKLAGVLVRDGILTHFQAERFLEGKWRGFNIGSKYKVLEHLGAGGMGLIYLCEHRLMRRRVALKVLPKDKARDSSARERFEREARAVAALDHPNIVRAYDIDEDRDRDLHFLVMEFVDGSSLQEIVKRSGPMDITRACHYMRQAADGLQHAHEKANIVHRDIKPGNILVDRNGIVKILDMGLARFFNDEDDAITKKYDENVLGTADYLAPEQAVDSHDVTIQADIYSLGATFYYCLTGRSPFSEGTVAQKLIWHQTRQPKSLKLLRPDVPAELVAIVERMMAKAPEDRFLMPQDVSDVLAPWTQSTIPPPPEAEMPQLSLAARGNTTGGSDSSLPGGGSTFPAGPNPSEPVSPISRRPWQVSTTPPPMPLAPNTASTPRTTPIPPPPVVTLPNEAPTIAPGPQGANPSTPTNPRPVGTRPEIPPPPPVPSFSVAPVAPETTLTDEAPEATGQLEENELFASFTKDAPETAKARSTRRIPKLTMPPEIKRWRLHLGLGAAGILIGAVLAWILLQSWRKPVTPPVPPQARTISVGVDADYRTLNQALVHARSGDRIVINKEVLSERLQLDEKWAKSHRDIHIVADSKLSPVLWKAPPDEEQVMIQLSEIEGLTLEGFILDGENKFAGLVQVNCCRGLTLKNIILKNYKEFGIQFNNCPGTAEKPLRLSGVEAASDLPPLWFEVKRFFQLADYKSNDFIVVEDNCTFTGKFRIPKVAANQEDNRGIKLPANLKDRVEERAPPPPPAPPPATPPMPMPEPPKP